MDLFPALVKKVLALFLVLAHGYIFPPTSSKFFSFSSSFFSSVSSLFKELEEGRKRKWKSKTETQEVHMQLKDWESKIDLTVADVFNKVMKKKHIR